MQLASHGRQPVTVVPTVHGRCEVEAKNARRRIGRTGKRLSTWIIYTMATEGHGALVTAFPGLLGSKRQ